jgi:hypothetical protein
LDIRLQRLARESSSRRYYGNIGAGFLAAVLAHGDICFIAANPAEEIVWSIGVTTFGGKQAADAWRRVLNGQLMTPGMPERRAAW